MDYKNLIGDGKLPNMFWVSLSNDYSYHHKDDRVNYIDWIGDIMPSFKSEGKTIATPFSTYEEAKRFCDNLYLGLPCDNFILNRITIEDRLSGQVYEKEKIFTPDTCTVDVISYKFLRGRRTRGYIVQRQP